MDLLITFFYWLAWVVLVGVPLAGLAWLGVDELRVRLAARNEAILREREARR